MANDTKIIHSLVCDNGGVLTTVPYPNIINMSQPDVYTPSDAKLYEIATKYEFGGRAWHYSQAIGTVGGNLGVVPYNHQDVGYKVAAATSAVGATSISVTTTVNDNLAGVAAKDELKGGFCVIFEKTLGVGYEQVRGIVGNDALAAYGTLKIYLDTPLTQAFTVAVSYAEAVASPWAKVSTQAGSVLGSGLNSCCGIPACYATTGQYLWVQTWGPCWTSPSAEVGNNTNNNRAVYTVGNGSFDDGTSATVLAQYAGWALANDYAGSQGAPFVYLQIAR